MEFGLGHPARISMVLGLLITVFASACNDVPVHDVTDKFAVQVKEVVKEQGTIKLDFLWVIDNSSSMCQEQAALAASFTDFQYRLSTYLNIDIRLAVTTTDALNNAGKFVNTPAETFPPGCYESRVEPCLRDTHCVNVYGAGWQCSDDNVDAADAEMYNLNGSVNTSCMYRCLDDSQCCQQFCFSDLCGSDQSCLEDSCVSDAAECVFVCRQPGTDASGCLRPPDTLDCPSAVPKVLSMDTLDQFKCLATVETEQAFSANMEQGLKAAWLALDPDGANTEQSQMFMRPDAYLIVVFVSDEDDCSIHEDFCAPNSTCEDSSDCTTGATCKLDYRASQLAGKPVKLCCGTVKKDYYNICALLSDYRGRAHHECAYDLACSDCVVDEDCNDGWTCQNVYSSVRKCRPDIYSLGSIATYQSPPGTPIYALRGVSEYYSKFRSLKNDPAKVLVAVITGDGIVRSDDEESLISDACLADESMPKCQAYSSSLQAASAACVSDPSGEGCEDLYVQKLDCIRECYVASKGNAVRPQIARSSYICASNYGQADFGSRYVKMAEMFGPNGVVSNICSDQGIAPALTNIAETIIRRVTKICLPRAVKEGQMVVVKKITMAEDGSRVEEVLTLGEGPDGDYDIESPVQECCYPDALGNCTRPLSAVTFNDVLDPNTTIEISYESTLGEE